MTFLLIFIVKGDVMKKVFLLLILLCLAHFLFEPVLIQDVYAREDEEVSERRKEIKRKIANNNDKVRQRYQRKQELLEILIEEESKHPGKELQQKDINQMLREEQLRKVMAQNENLQEIQPVGKEQRMQELYETQETQEEQEEILPIKE